MPDAATVNGKGGVVAPASTRIDQMIAELSQELESAKEQRDLIAQQLAEHDAIVLRIDGALKSLSGPVRRGPYNKASHHSGALKDPDPEALQLVEATIVRLGDSVSMAEILEAIPGRSENTVRRLVYTLRDSGRIRLVRAQKGPHPAIYAAMPEVVAEHS